MFKVYQEHENFGAYTAFDLTMGKLHLIDEGLFEEYDKTALKFSNPNPSSLHTRFPRRFYFQITRNCQLTCDYCYVKAGPNQPHLPKNVIFEIADYAGEHGLMDVRLTGGEATIHPDFIEICERFHKNNIYVTVGTNGLWTNPIKEFLSSQKYFSISVTIDGSEMTHSAYREGSHKSLLKNLRELRNNNPYIRIRINMVVTKSNKYQYPELVRFADEISAESLTFLPLRPRLSNPELLPEVLSAEDFKEVIYNATRSYTSDKKIGSPTPKNIIQQDENTFAVFKNRPVCYAGRERIDMSFDAENNEIMIIGCSFSPALDKSVDSKIREAFISGRFDYDNIDKIKQIWEDNSKWNIFRDRSLKQSACTTCPSFGKSCAGTGYCHIQNHKYAQLSLERNIEEQIKTQMLELPSWCELTKTQRV